MNMEEMEARIVVLEYEMSAIECVLTPSQRDTLLRTLRLADGNVLTLTAQSDNVVGIAQELLRKRIGRLEDFRPS